MRAGWLGIALLAGGCWMSHGALDEDVGDARHGDEGTVPDAADADADADAADADADAADAPPEAPPDAVIADGGEITEPPCLDEDGDGHPSTACGGDDCNDANPFVFPGAFDACGDGIDTNCDGLDPHGGLLGPPMLVLDHPHTTGNLYTALLWTGREYVFLWRFFAGEGIFVRRIDGAGKLVGDEVRLRSFESAFDVIWNGTRIGAAWGAGVEGAMNVWFQTFDRLGNPLIDAVAIRTSPDIGIDGGVTYGPRIAAMGEDFAVLWSEQVPDEGNASVYVARVDSTGVVRGGPVLVGRYEGGDAPKLSLDWSGSTLLALWTTEGGRRFVPSTVLSRPFSMELDPLADELVLGESSEMSATEHQTLWAGDAFLAMWSSAGWPDAAGDVHATRLDEAGGVLADGVMDAPVVGHFRQVRPVVWNRDRLVVLWNDYRVVGSGLTLSRHEENGVRVGESIAVPTESRADRLYVATTGAEYGFVWSQEDEAGYRVYFQRASFCD